MQVEDGPLLQIPVYIIINTDFSGKEFSYHSIITLVFSYQIILLILDLYFMLTHTSRWFGTFKGLGKGGSDSLPSPSPI